jgi:hypothetical protein
MPSFLIVVFILFWPPGLIWPTQLMKDSLVFLFLVMTIVAGVAIVDGRDRLRGVAGAALLLTTALVPLIRLRVYVGRIVLLAVGVAACMAVLRLAFDRRAWRGVLGSAAVFAIIYWGLIVIIAPDPYVVFAPVTPEVSVGQRPSRFEQFEFALKRIAESAVRAVISPSPGFEGAADIGNMRQKFAVTAGDSAGDISRHLTGWGDIIRFAPEAAATGFFAPFPWDVFRPRGITGIFRTLDVSESLLMLLLLPALIAGVLRLRRPEEWLVLAVSGGGILAMGLVVTNIGTLVRLRVAFTLLFVAFASYGFDVYPKLFALVPWTRTRTQ